MKKYLALILSVLITVSLAACGSSGGTASSSKASSAAPSAASSSAPASSASSAASSAASSSKASSAAASSKAASDVKADITLWTYPIGKWGDQATVNGIIANFNKVYPNVKVTVQYLDYQTGDDQVTSAIQAGTAPDIIMEGPERLVANWGAAGKMVDISDLWTSEAAADIAKTSAALEKSCKSATGAHYEYPLCMTVHCMAINYDVFKKADALKYLDEKTRTWTTENFGKALKAVKDSGLVQETGVVYCGGQGGDQGTRALAMNLYSAQFTNADHTQWTMNSDAGVKGLQQLVSWTKDGVLGYDAGIQAADELQLFANGTTAMSICWNASNESKYAASVSFTPFAMAFPSDDGKPELCGGIWGFGIFNNNNADKIAAAKAFIRFVCDDKTQGPASVTATGFFPVRASFGNVYKGTADETRMAAFASMLPYIGDYYNVTLGWAQQRTAWWGMLQQIFGGTDVKTAVGKYVETCNAATKAASK